MPFKRYRRSWKQLQEAATEKGYVACAAYDMYRIETKEGEFSGYGTLGEAFALLSGLPPITKEEWRRKR